MLLNSTCSVWDSQARGMSCACEISLAQARVVISDGAAEQNVQILLRWQAGRCLAGQQVRSHKLCVHPQDIWRLEKMWLGSLRLLSMALLIITMCVV